MSSIREMEFLKCHFSPIDYHEFVAMVGVKDKVYAVDETTMRVNEDNPIFTFAPTYLMAWLTTYKPVINDGKALVRIEHERFFILTKSSQQAAQP